MRFFPLLDFQYAMLLIFLGLIALVLIYVAFSSYDFLPRKRGEKEEVEEYPGGIQASNKPIPLILIFVYAGLAIWAVAYVVVIGIKGDPF
jgi:hypothetical protein